jgi:AraC-like DNA-binding protein
MVSASLGLHAAFERHAQCLFSRLRRDDTVAGRAREAMVAELQSGDPSMEVIARKMAMSVATLRRRLEDEGTSHRQLLDEVRCGLAKRYLLEGNLAISEVAFLLGFAHVTAFYKAFRRWMDGATPAQYRTRARRARLVVPPSRATG